MTDTQNSDQHVLLEALRVEAHVFFQAAAGQVSKEYLAGWELRDRPDFYWDQLSPENKLISRTLTDRLLRLSAQIADLLRGTPLLGSEDMTDLREATKSMRGALRLRRYRFHDIAVLNDEDRVLGVQPAHQTDNEASPPLEADGVFHDFGAKLWQLLRVIHASAQLAPQSQEASGGKDATRYRPGTAFIMMWMDPSKPELIDVVDAIKTTFRQYRINAVRADDIEHDGQITQRVLNELRTSEFLFADLTGARPNVYYEVGYAHALGRRVILYRHAGTGIHFDLAGYNCPEYKHLKDLREKLAKRLENITNRPAESDA